jgi:hypothetical protein
MKTLFVIVSFITVLLIGGCHESQISQPDLSFKNNTDKTAFSVSSTGLHPYEQEIKLCCKAYDPVSGDCKINGKVTYIHDAVRYADGLWKVNLKIELDAELCTRLLSAVKFTIYGNSYDVVMVVPSGSKPLEKNYAISFRPDLRLGVLYKVTADEIEISRICLHQIDTQDYQISDK